MVYPVYTSVDGDDAIDGSDDTNTVVYPLYTSVDEDDIIDGNDDARFIGTQRVSIIIYIDSLCRDGARHAR